MKKLLGMFAFMFVFLTGFLALAADVPPDTVDGLMPFLGRFVEGITAGNYQIAGGVLIMALMVGVRQYGIPKWNIDANALPYYSALIGAIGFGGLAMSTGGDFLVGAKGGLVASLLAGGLWDSLGKYLFKLLLGDNYEATTQKSEIVTVPKETEVVAVVVPTTPKPEEPKQLTL